VCSSDLAKIGFCFPMAARTSEAGALGGIYKNPVMFRLARPFYKKSMLPAAAWSAPQNSFSRRGL
jgi:hypothetical protein